MNQSNTNQQQGTVLYPVLFTQDEYFAFTAIIEEELRRSQKMAIGNLIQPALQRGLDYLKEKDEESKKKDEEIKALTEGKLTPVLPIKKKASDSEKVGESAKPEPEKN